MGFINSWWDDWVCIPIYLLGWMRLESWARICIAQCWIPGRCRLGAEQVLTAVLLTRVHGRENEATEVTGVPEAVGVCGSWERKNQGSGILGQELVVEPRRPRCTPADAGLCVLVREGGRAVTGTGGTGGHGPPLQSSLSSDFAGGGGRGRGPVGPCWGSGVLPRS